MLSLGRKRFKRVLAAVGSVAVIGGSVGVAINADHDAGLLLRVLSPPGAGYDSTNIALTTGSGGAVTVTAATPRQMCPDSNGTLRALSANQPCVVDGLSLKVRSAVTNNLLQSEALDNASWLNQGTPVVTANSWDIGTGSSTGETILDDDGAASEGRNQSFTTAATGAYTASCYMQSGTITTARVVMTVNGGGTGTGTCAISGLSSTTSRQTCTITAAGVVTSINVNIVVGAAAGDTGSIKVGGCQLVTGSVPGDYCPTTTAASTCTAETVTVATPAGLSLTEGCACFTFTPTWTGNAPSNLSFLDPVAASVANFASSTSGFNTMFFSDGSTASPVNAGFTSGTRKRYCARWSAVGNFHRLENVTDGVSASQVFTTLPALDATIGVGQVGGSSQNNGLMDSIVLGRSPTACN